ncbi:Pkinase-domain-containing protein [Phlegmacium glaucopus]|nr:Pkinase-domain-containing protein [Phlegmacium glaucopus]
MPPGTGVVDALKNFIRHGKHHHRNISPPPADTRDLPQHQPRTTNTPAAPVTAQTVVIEERKEQSTMTTYKGLENFKLEIKMGDGAFSNVFKALEISTGNHVAIKAVRKFELNASQEGDKHLNPQFKKKPRVTERANILKEVQIMRGTSHPSIVKLYSFLESAEHYFLVMELMEGGELFHQIVKFTYFSENLARHVILQVVHGIRYLHEERGIVHRDIKPENLLYEPIPIIPSKTLIRRPYDEEKEDEGEFIPGVGGGGIGRVKIADFGLSKVVWNEETMTPCGTVGYTAPEIVKDERYSKSVDMWALGCVLYTLLCGFPPFYDESINVLTEKVSRGYYTFLSPWWDDISGSAKDLITHLLCVDPAQRYTIDEFLVHPWATAATAPPPQMSSVYSHIKELRPLDSPFLTSVRGRVHEGRSPGVATLKEAFDITYAVHRMEEEGRRRNYNGRDGAGARGFLTGLNEEDEDGGVDEDEGEPEESEPHRQPYRQQEHMDQPHRSVMNGQSRQKGGVITLAGAGTGANATKTRSADKRAGHKGFELNMGNATLLGRRHNKHSSPLAGKPIGSGSPLKLDSLRMEDVPLTHAKD